MPRRDPFSISLMSSKGPERGAAGGPETIPTLTIFARFRETGRTVGLFSLEMSETELGVRALTGQARVNSQVLRRGAAREAELHRLGAARDGAVQRPALHRPVVGADSVRHSRARQAG